MAKRKRLTPAQPGYLGENPTPEPPAADPSALGFPAAVPMTPGAVPPSARAPAPLSPAPIAQVAGDAASAAALEELAGEMRRARDEGRMIQPLPLDAIDAGYLQRDRITADTADLAELKHSIEARGQQTPIEVVAQSDGRFGLISGWRRLTALRQLHEETGAARFGTALAILRKPETAADAYVAMVEENEIRLGLSYYERARIAAKAVQEGVYATEKQALQQLFKSASRAKRSKIGAFLVIYRELDAVLRFPNALTERVGIQLSHLLEDDPSAAEAMRARLRASPADRAELELEVLRQPITAASGRAGAPQSSGQSTGQSAPASQPQAPEPASVTAAPPSRLEPTPAAEPIAPPPGPAAKQTAPDGAPDGEPKGAPEAGPRPEGQAPEQTKPVPPAVTIARLGADRLMLTGPGVTEAFQAQLTAWLAARSEEG